MDEIRIEKEMKTSHGDLEYPEEIVAARLPKSRWTSTNLIENEVLPSAAHRLISNVIVGLTRPMNRCGRMFVSEWLSLIQR